MIGWNSRYLLTFTGLAYVSFRLHYRKRTENSFLGLLFPKAIYLHISARDDHGIFLINLLISQLLLFGAGLQAWRSIKIGGGLIDFNDRQAVFIGEWNAATCRLFILVYTLSADLSVYIIYRFHHQSDVFWPWARAAPSRLDRGQSL